MLNLRSAFVAAFGLALLASSARAQSGADILAGVRALDCTFPVATTVTWKNDVPEPRVRSGATLALKVSDIEVSESSGKVVNGNGSESEVTVQVYGWNLHVLDSSRSGRLAVTSVFAQKVNGEKFKAVHTRTDYLPIDLPGFKSEPEVTQFFGDCAVTVAK